MKVKHLVLTSKVGPTVAEDIKTNAYWAVLSNCVLLTWWSVIENGNIV
jgi:preprotein translocase subunit SecF